MNRRQIFWFESALNFGLLATFGILIAQDNPWIGHLSIIILLPVLGFRSFALMHEASHGLLSQSRFINDLWGVIWGSVALLPHGPWRVNHMLHHKWAGNIDRDPSMALVKFLPTLPSVLIRLLSFAWRKWIPLTGFLQHVSFWIHCWRLSFSYRGRDFTHWVSLTMPLIYLCAILACAHDISNLISIGISYAIFFAGIEVINFPHHLRLPHLPASQHLPPRQQNLVTRTCVYPKWISRFIVLNFNYHTEHHYATYKPWHELPELHEKLLSDNKVPNLDYGLNWVTENRHLNIIDLIAEPKDGSDKSNDVGFNPAANE